MLHLPNGSTFRASHSDGSFKHYMAPNLVNCGSTSSYKPRLARRDGSCGFCVVGLFSGLRHRWYLVLFTMVVLFFLMVSMLTSLGKSHPALDEGQFSLSFNWIDSTSLRLAQKDPFAAALPAETESSVRLSKGQSSSSQRQLFCTSEVEESGNEEENREQKNANLDAILDFLPCSQPHSDEEIHHHNHSRLKYLEDESDLRTKP